MRTEFKALVIYFLIASIAELAAGIRFASDCIGSVTDYPDSFSFWWWWAEGSRVLWWPAFFLTLCAIRILAIKYWRKAVMRPPSSKPKPENSWRDEPRTGIDFFCIALAAELMAAIPLSIGQVSLGRKGPPFLVFWWWAEGPRILYWLLFFATLSAIRILIICYMRPTREPATGSC